MQDKRGHMVTLRFLIDGDDLDRAEAIEYPVLVAGGIPERDV
jgi:hypothetical protein